MFLLAFGVGYAPWPLRNFAVLGEPVLTTTWAGPTLYDSLGPQATGASDMRFLDPDSRAIGTGTADLWDVPPEWRDERVRKLARIDAAYLAAAQALVTRRVAAGETDSGAPYTFTAADDREVIASLTAADRAVIRPYRPAEVRLDRDYRRAALDAAFADPGRVARLAVVKQGRFWRPWPVGGVPGGIVGGAVQAGFAAYFVPLVALAVWGGVQLWRRSWPHTSRVPGPTSDTPTENGPDRGTRVATKCCRGRGTWCSPGVRRSGSRRFVWCSWGACGTGCRGSSRLRSRWRSGCGTWGAAESTRTAGPVASRRAGGGGLEPAFAFFSRQGRRCWFAGPSGG